MLIHLKNYVPEQILSNENVVSVDNLLRSFQEKKHILLTKKSFFKHIIDEKNSLYSYNTKQVAFEAMKGQAEYSSLINLVSFYIVVDFNIKDNTTKWTDNGNVVNFTVGPQYFKDSSRLQASNIIFENITDNDFYKIIVNYFSRQHKTNLCNIICNPINGGGGTTKEVFERHIQNNDLVLCLLDNDKKHPKGPLGSTSKAFGKEKFNKSGMVKILDVHEIESLIPIETLEKSVTTGTNKNKTIEFLRASLQHNESMKFYFDHKKGLELKAAFELDKLHGPFWIPLLKSSPDLKKSDCLDEERCACKPPCIKIDGFGENILSKSIEFIQKGNLQIYNPKLSPLLENHWLDIGKLLFSWCCGPSKKTRLT